MVGNEAYNIYQKNSVLTANQGTLVLKLYEGAMKFIIQALHESKQGNIAKQRENILKAQDIIMELRVTLNKEYSIAMEMEQMYEFIYSLLIDANIYQDTNKLEQALFFIKEFSDIWKQVMLKKA